jgi:ABC-type oligopeptide transport system substrate-binding subunit
MDPSDIFSAWYGKNGPQNYSRWTNPAFHDLASQIERETDDARRKTMVRKAEDMLEMDPPLIPVSYEQIYDAGTTRSGPEPVDVLRHLRRRAVGQRLAC